MRRVTIFADEADARKAVAWLEEHGLDFMSEDYAAPPRPVAPLPSRRAAPERQEPPGGFLRPLMRGRPMTLREAIGIWVKQEQSTDRAFLRSCAIKEGWHPKLVKDTVRRMVNAGELVEFLDQLSLPEKDNG
jgi:hypothetical protein